MENECRFVTHLYINYRPACVVSLGCRLLDVEPELSKIEGRLYLYLRNGREQVFEGYPVSDSGVVCLNRMNCECRI